jgi:hypothetical protein
MNHPSPAPSRSSRTGQILIIGLIVLGMILVLFFGFRAVRSYLRIQQTGLQPGVSDVELIRGWMTIPYIAAAYGVPEAYIFTQIGIPQTDNQNKSLGQLNREYAPGEPAAILNAVKEAVRQYQAEHPPTPESQP